MADPTDPSDAITWRALLAETAEALGDRHQARWLCEAASGAAGEEFVPALDEPATLRMVGHLDTMLARFRGGEPLQYVLGSWQFRHLELMVDPRVLIPRPETEWVCEAALGIARSIPAPRTIVDLGTGSGAIGLSLAYELPVGSTTVWLVDVSADALDVARANLAGVGRAASAVRIAEGSWFDALPDSLRESLDLVVANPPYIADDDPEMEPAVREWEPHSALFAGDDGLDDIRSIVSGGVRWIRPGGHLVLEIGHQQGAAVTALLRAADYANIEVRPDLAGRDRIAIGRRAEQ